MSGFVTTDPVAGTRDFLKTEAGSAVELERSNPEIVTADGWLPDIVVADIRGAVRVSSATDIRLRDAIRAAILSVRRDLACWRWAHEAAGATSLADVPASQVDGQSLLVRSYNRAIASLVAADLAETHFDATATDKGADRLELRAVPAEDHRRNALWAIRDILGVGRTTVDLI